MKKSLIILMLIVFVMPIFIPTISSAGLRDQLRGEASSRPVSSGGGSSAISPEGGGGSTPSGPSTSPNDPIESNPNIVSHTVYTYVNGSFSGNVWEDLKNLDEESGTFTRNNILDENEKGTLNQNNIKLEIRKEGTDEVYATPSIGSDGSYSFNASEEGNYYTRIYYGLLEDNNSVYNNSERVKSILKYNGQDYISSKAGTDNEIDLSWREEIIKSGKGCTQIYLALDCSGSMIINEYNGVSRLEAEINMAKELIEELLEENGNNIYIGIVAFGEYPYKIQGLTKSKQKLFEKLDQALEDATNTEYYAGSTDIRSVLYGIRNNKTKQVTDDGSLVYNDEEYFVNTDRDTSNRYIFLLSDGVPLSDGTTVVYNDDSDQAIENKIKAIVDTTRDEMRAILDEGIYESVLITKTGDEEVDGYVNDMCNIENLKRYLVGIDTAVNKVAEYVKQHILDTTVAENTSSSTIFIEAGLEDSARRAEVNQNYNIVFNNQEASEFLILDNYNSNNSEHREIAKEISDKAYCFADTKSYHLYPKDTQWTTGTENGVNPDGSTYTITYVTVASENIEGVDLVLTQRDNFMIEPTIKVTGVRISLPDGSSLIEDFDRDAGFIDSNLETGKIQEIKGLQNPILYYLDPEITQGSKVDIEYTVILKNTSPVTSLDFSIIAFAPKGFIINPDERLLTVSATNGDYGWSAKNINTLVDDELVEYNEDEQETECARMKLGTAVNNGLVRNSTIGMNGERYVKFVASKLITTGSLKEEKDNYVADVEILEYTTTIGRRMQYANTNAKGVTFIPLETVVPGTYTEEDFTSSDEVIIIPPTGIVYPNSIDIKMIYIVFAILAMVIIGNYIYRRKK